MPMPGLNTGMFPKLRDIGHIGKRWTWQPSRGSGSTGTLSVDMASNMKSVGINFDATCKHLSEFPRNVFAPLSKAALNMAIELSSGPGRPVGYYSLRRPRQPSDYIINIDSGLMVRSWKRRGVQVDAKAVRMALYNTARSNRGFNYPLALFTGTIKMRDRPLPQKLQALVAPERRRLMRMHTMRVRRAWGKRAAVT